MGFRVLHFFPPLFFPPPPRMKLVEKPLLVAQWHTHVQPAMESPTWGRLLKSFFACNLQTYNFMRCYERESH